MKRILTSKIAAIVLVAVILAAVTAVASHGGAAENVVGVVLWPLRTATSAVTRQAERVYNYMFGYESLAAENRALQQRIADMEAEVRTAESYRRENERLTRLLDLSEAHPDYAFASAYLIGWDSSNWKSAFTIDKGSNSGIARGMCAVTEFGQVVGIVTDVGTNWAVVTTVLDSSMEISASVASSGYTGVVQGSHQSGMQLRYLPADAALKNGDQVVTTDSSLYPKDLLLGYIRDAGIDETGVSKYASLEPAAGFDALEQVFIITEYTNP